MTEKRFSATNAHRLDDPARLQWLPPDRVIEALPLKSGETVADVGAGTGYFTMPLAEFVGAHGNIYAVDAQSEMLAILRQKLVGNLLSNVELIHAEAESTSIPASCADLLFLANVWHEMENYDSVLEESRRILNTSGRIAILDWRVDVEPRVGPPLAHRVEAARVVQQLQQAGYSSVNSSEIGSYSWLVTGKRC